MLPFLINQKEASVAGPAQTVQRKPDEEKAEDQDLDLLSEAMLELLNAIKSEDLIAMGEAFEAAKQIVDAQPFLEGGHNG